MVRLYLHMLGVSGKNAVELFLEESPDTHVVMLTVSESADDLVDTLRAGASGYLLKNIESDTLLDLIRRAVTGDSVVSVDMTTRLVKGLRAARSSDSAKTKDALSPREHEILGYLAKDASDKEIARSLDLAASTVKIYEQHILRKRNFSSRVQAAVYAIEHGLASS